MDEYPTTEQLNKIIEWECFTFESSLSLAEYIFDLWHFENWATLEGKRVKTLRLATGGWSGNEDILSALRKNFIFHSKYWESSHKGGLVIYKIKK